MDFKKIILFSFFIILFGCSNQINIEEIEEVNKEEKIIYNILQGNMLLLDKKYRLAALSYEKALEEEYNFEIAFINLEIYLNNRDIFNINKTINLIKEYNDFEKIYSKINKFSLIKLSYYIKDYNMLSQEILNIFEKDNNISNKIKNIYNLAKFMKNENFNSFNNFIEKNNIKNDYFLVLYDQKKNENILKNNISKGYVNWEIINIITEYNEKNLVESYFTLGLNEEDSNIKKEFFIKSLSLSMEEENYEKTIEVLNYLIIDNEDFKYLFTKLDYLFYLERYEEFYNTYIKTIDISKTEIQSIYLNIAYLKYLEKNNKTNKIKNFLKTLGNKFENDFIHYYIKYDLVDNNDIENINEDKKYNQILNSYYNLDKKEEFFILYERNNKKYPNKINDLMYYRLNNYQNFYNEGMKYYYSGVVENNHSDILNFIAYEIAKNSDSKMDLEFAYTLSLESIKFINEEELINNYYIYDTLAFINYKMGNYEEAYAIMRNHIIQKVPFIIINEDIKMNYKKILSKIKAT